MNVTPYHQFKSAIANKLIDNGTFCPDWFKAQEWRLSLYWNNNETPDSAFGTLRFFAEAQVSNRGETTMDALRKAGCEI